MYVQYYVPGVEQTWKAKYQDEREKRQQPKTHCLRDRLAKSKI